MGRMRMRSTTTFRRGRVVVVNVPFSDQTGSKPRPALVVSAERFHRTLPDVIVCPISSQPRYFRRPGPGDCLLRNWQAVGLRHPSTVRISNHKGLIDRVLGSVRGEDLTTVGRGLREALGL